MRSITIKMSTTEPTAAEEPDFSTADINPAALTEDQALAILKRVDLPAKTIEQISKNAGVIGSRKGKQAIAQHPHTPRHIALPLLRHLFTVELMQLELAPLAPPEIKKAAGDVLLRHVETMSLGEKVSLGRRASAQIAGSLLRDSEPRVFRAALENPRLTEAAIIQALMHRDARAEFVQSVACHAKWSLRREVRIALLRNKNTPLAQALKLARRLPAPLLREVLESSSLPEEIKAQVSLSY